MLANLFKNIFSRHASKQALAEKRDELAVRAAKAMADGSPRIAIGLYREFLALEPHNADGLNNLGVCLAEVGDISEAYRAFDLAYSLNDSNMAVVVNHARHLIDNKDIGSAMPHLMRARVTIPHYPYINAVYATTRLAIGDPNKARAFTLQAWLAQFDNLRLANSYLFTSSYSEIPEDELASEHKFWAETCCAPAVAIDDCPSNERSGKGRKMRIGYWSPDLRSHSVRYFFRPLLEGHDRANVEIFLYHDSHVSDEQTALIKAGGDHFHETSDMPDAALTSLIISHDLDVLIEMAGHTSHNRLNLLKYRLARVQLTGIGYPPTTGLSSLDGKFSDPYVVGNHPEKYYSEEPLVLPSTFWCFDPMEEAAAVLEPPVIKNGYVTFACVGNIAKINPKALRLWAEVLRRVPMSRLILRAVNFIDQEAVNAMKEKLLSCGLPAERVEIAGPAAGAGFFETYNDVDIILDTMPFTGGTTTCFAVYMGVPVISLRGDSLIGRMGYSVLANLDAEDLAVDSENAYINRAITLSQDIAYLRNFRKNARTLMKSRSLGNGALFAKDVESACRVLLDRRSAGVENKYQAQIRDLPARELIRRAYTVLGHQQNESAARIVAYCMRSYPNYAPAHILATDAMTAKNDFRGAAEYLLSRLPQFDAVHQCATLLNVVRFHLLAEDPGKAWQTLKKIDDNIIQDDYDRCQRDLYLQLVKPTSPRRSEFISPPQVKIRVVCLMPCDQVELYEALVSRMRTVCNVPPNFEVVYDRCSETDRVDAYGRMVKNRSADICVLLQKNIAIHQSKFFDAIAHSLQSSDIVGFSGALDWRRLDWQTDEFHTKAAGFITRSTEKPGAFEVNIRGGGRASLVGDMAVLDGRLIAFNRLAVQNVQFDEELTQAGLLLEEAWSFSAFRAGLRVTVHRNLGVEFIPGVVLDERYLAAAKTHLISGMALDPFALESEDNMLISAPVESAARGVEILGAYFD